MPRVFFGIEFEESMKQSLLDTKRNLETAGVRAGNWSDPSLYHVTVLFLGEVPLEELPKLHDAASQAVKDVPSFQLKLAAVGSFERNRILWVGFGPTDGLTVLKEVYHNLHSKIEPLNLVQLDSRPYSPHITLARKLDVPTFTPVRSHIEAPSQVVPVTDLCLFESTRVGGKLVYPILRRFPLRG